MEHFFRALGRRIHPHRRAVLAAWAVLLLVAAIGAVQLPGVLLGGSGSVAGSASERVEATLQRDFETPFARPLTLVLSSERHTVDDATFREWLGRVATELAALPQVRRVTSYFDAQDPRLRSADGHQTMVLIGLDVASRQQEEAAVPLIRKALAGLYADVRAADPAGVAALTGPSAIIYDLNQHNQVDGHKAELKALPLTALILVFAFGALVATAVPLAVGLAGTAIALGLAFGLAHAVPLSNLLQNVVTMIGLAIGIDYSLLMISRFRQELPERSLDEAVAETLARGGPAVVYSGLTVMIGLGGLFLSPLMELKSVGFGGALVVAVSVLAATTLLPALLGVLGERINSPRWMARTAAQSARTAERWRALAAAVMARPGRAIALSLALVALFAWPALSLQIGFPSGNWYPASMEARAGIQLLERMGQGNAVYPIHLVVRSTDGRPPVATGHLGPLLAFTRQLKADPRVGTVLSPLTLREGLGPLQYALFYRHLDAAFTAQPLVRELFFSKDRQAVFYQVVPAAGLPYAEIQQLARDLATRSVGAGLTLDVGGQPVYYNDIDAATKASYGPVIGFVIGVTFLVLLIAYRSVLLPLKAIAMNMLAVAAGYGAIVAVFQFGWAGPFFGLESPLSAIPAYVPLIVFCVMFGLSMDYEVFLLHRIAEAYGETGDNRAATAAGLAATGSVITSAALVMAVVFGAFAWAEVVIIKLIGLGLAATVLVDAAVIRVLLVPALMRLAGRWNWWPGDRGAAGSPVNSPAAPGTNDTASAG